MSRSWVSRKVGGKGLDPSPISKLLQVKPKGSCSKGYRINFSCKNFHDHQIYKNLSNFKSFEFHKYKYKYKYKKKKKKSRTKTQTHIPTNLKTT